MNKPWTLYKSFCPFFNVFTSSTVCVRAPCIILSEYGILARIYIYIYFLTQFSTADRRWIFIFAACALSSLVKCRCRFNILNGMVWAIFFVFYSFFISVHVESRGDREREREEGRGSRRARNIRLHSLLFRFRRCQFKCLEILCTSKLFLCIPSFFGRALYVYGSAGAYLDTENEIRGFSRRRLKATLYRWNIRSDTRRYTDEGRESKPPPLGGKIEPLYKVKILWTEGHSTRDPQECLQVHPKWEC